MQLLTYFKTFISKIKDTKSIIAQPQPQTNNLDLKKMQELLIREFAIQQLEKMKKDVELKYLKYQNLEKTEKPHTQKHLTILQHMHDLANDLTKITVQINLLLKDSQDYLISIKKDLNLTH